MYLAEFEDVRQACLRLVPPRPGADAAWWSTLRTLVRSVDAIPDWSASVRLVLTPGRGLDHVLLLAANAHDERMLRETVAAFLRVAVISADSIQVPLSRAEYDKAISGFPRHRCYVDASFDDEARTRWFACDFRVAPMLPQLLTVAHLRGYRIGYHANLRSFAPTNEEKRAVLKNASLLDTVAGISDDALAYQRSLANDFRHATALIDEYVAVDSRDAASLLARQLDSQFDASYGPYQFGDLRSICTIDDFEDQLTSPRVDAPAAGRDYACSHAVGPDVVVDVLCTHAGADVANRYLQPPRETLVGVPRPERRKHTEAVEPCVFVSYKREDFARISHVLDFLRKEGWPVWYDDGIPGGAQWMDELERHLRAAFAVLLFVSHRSLESEYVKLEITYAMSLRSTIVPVSLEPVALEGGLAMVVSALQQLDSRSPRFEALLVQALGSAAAHAGVVHVGHS